MQSSVWAVLIGLNFYPNLSNRLRGTINDIDDVETSLKAFYGAVNVMRFAAQVTGKADQTAPPGPPDQWPTFDNITAGLKKVADQASPNDKVYVHYSGHGTLQSTSGLGYNYQDDNGVDAALVLYEPNARERIRYLRGIELASSLDHLVNKGLKLTVILDACHAGGISRDDEPDVRGMSWSAEVAAEFPSRIPEVGSSFPFADTFYRDAQLKNSWLLNPHGFTLIAACEPHEQAKEIRVGRERFHGALSYHLLEAFAFHSSDLNGTVTHDMVYRRVCAKMYAKVDGQHPVFIGSEATALIDSELPIERSSYTCEVVKVSSDDSIWLNVGHVHGFCIGDEFLIHTPSDAYGSVSVAVTDVHALHAVAKPMSVRKLEPNTQRVLVGCHATLTAFAKPRASVIISKEAEHLWRRSIDDSMYLRLLSHNTATSIDIPAYSISLTSDRLYDIRDSMGRKIRELSGNSCIPNRAEQDTTLLLEHLTKFGFIQHLSNRLTNVLPDSDFDIEVFEASAESEDFSEYHCTIQEGERLDIVFRNLTSQMLYITVLDLTPLKGVKRLYPPQNECQAVLPNFTKNVLPRSVTDQVTPPGSVRFKPRMRIPLQIKRNCGLQAIDVLKFIVSSGPLRGLHTLELPDFLGQDAMRDDNTGTLFAAEFLKVAGLERAGSILRGDEDMIRWTSRSITIHTLPVSDPVT